MGHFEIDLPENKKGEVQWGSLRKMQFSFFRKHKSELKKGYVVFVQNANTRKEYRLFKSENGEWSIDPDGKIKLQDTVHIEIKNAILEKESGLT
jgi:hypothetical protein